MKKLFCIAVFVATYSISMELQKYFPQQDDVVHELLCRKQPCTNYLHLVPQDVLAKNLFPYCPVTSTAGVLVGSLAGKAVPNKEIATRITHITREDALRLATNPRIIGCKVDLQEQDEQEEIIARAVEVDADAELSHFVSKKREELALVAGQYGPIQLLPNERRMSQRLKKIVNRERCYSITAHSAGCVMVSIFPIILAACWAGYKWPKSYDFTECRSAHWDGVQDESRASDYPCNITDIRLNHGSLEDCLEGVIAEICNSIRHKQMIINFMPLVGVVLLVIATHTMLRLFLKKCYRAPNPICSSTQEQIVLYEQLITQAEENMLPHVEEV